MIFPAWGSRMILKRCDIVYICYVHTGGINYWFGTKVYVHKQRHHRENHLRNNNYIVQIKGPHPQMETHEMLKT